MAWQSKIPELVSRAPAQAAAALDATGADIAETARALAPVETGRLRAGIAYNPATGQVVSEAAHGVYVELGTRHASAQPHIVPAVHEAGSRAAKRMKEVFEK